MPTIAMHPPVPKPSSISNRQSAWRLRIATLVFLTSAALALHCHNNNNNIINNNKNNNNNNINNNNKIDSENSETTQNKNIGPNEFESSNKNFPPKFKSNDVRGLIRTIRVALPPDRDSFQISPSDGSSQVKDKRFPISMLKFSFLSPLRLFGVFVFYKP